MRSRGEGPDSVGETWSWTSALVERKLAVNTDKSKVAVNANQRVVSEKAASSER